jgi:hypothetical protein
MAVHYRPSFRLAIAVALLAAGSRPVSAQSVGLPAPRLLNVTPMGGKAGSEFEVVVAGEHLEDSRDLQFSDRRIAAKPKRDAAGNRIPERYLVTIADDCPPGLFEARMLTRLGVSSSRAFAVGTLPEITPPKENRTIATAFTLPIPCVCNGAVAARSVDWYSFRAKKGQRLAIDCATRGIDSKLNATVIVADAAGRDLLVERRGGALAFAVPQDGVFYVKIHELTFNGGPAYYYRLGLWELPPGAAVVRQPSTKAVNAFSWPPACLEAQATAREVEPNDRGATAQKISLPCDVAGSFYPAADVDVFEFDAKKGDEWWIEVASERLGFPTDPAVLVQRVAKAQNGSAGQATDVLELSDVPSPVKVSTNGYAYDGPPYNAGTADALGKLAIKEDGRYTLQLRDLFGGTRSVPHHAYRLIIRRAAPDFALVAWALHQELRNGDRNALSKPIALRRGATMALEVVAFRRDGFDGPIDLAMDGLPPGVTAKGLSIPAGKSHGTMLITARADARSGYANASFVGRAVIAGKPATRPCWLASVAWPIPDSWGEIPSPRLLADVPVSVCDAEAAPLAIAPQTSVVEAKAGGKITIPLVLRRNCEFSGGNIQLRAIGAGFEKTPPVELSIATNSTQVTLDLKALKIPPGDHRVSFVGGAVAKYRHRPDVASALEAASQKQRAEAAALEAATKKAEAEAKSAPKEKRPQMAKAAAAVAEKMKAAKASLDAAERKSNAAKEAAQPKDIVDIVVCEPITIRVRNEEKK